MPPTAFAVSPPQRPCASRISNAKPPAFPCTASIPLSHVSNAPPPSRYNEANREQYPCGSNSDAFQTSAESSLIRAASRSFSSPSLGAVCLRFALAMQHALPHRRAAAPMMPFVPCDLSTVQSPARQKNHSVEPNDTTTRSAVDLEPRGESVVFGSRRPIMLHMSATSSCTRHAWSPRLPKRRALGLHGECCSCADKAATRIMLAATT